MVDFTSITQGIFLVSIMMLGSSEAAPAAGSKISAAPHANATAAAPFTRPPIISSRIKPITTPGASVNLNAESEVIEKNTKWYTEHGGNINNVTKRGETNSVGGMTLELPTNALPKAKVPSASSVSIANFDQVTNFILYSGVASTAYCKTVVPQGCWTCENCLKFVPDGKLLVTFTSSVSDTNGFVLRSDLEKTIHLVFRGTHSFRSAITDLVFDLAKYPPVNGAKVHRGFLASYNEVIATFFPVVQAQLTAYPDYKVAISGHSLGGAQALLAGMDLYQRDKRLTSKNLSIYTIGSPRVGNPAFAYYVDSTGIPYYRSVNDRDIVPHLPPQSFGYLHPGIEAWDRKSNTVQLCTGKFESKECSNSIVPFTSIAHHSTYYGIDGRCD